MSRPRHPKPDANQAEIFAALRDMGFTVIDVSSLPVPALDGFVNGYHHGRNCTTWAQVEIKMPGEQLNDKEWTYFCEHPDLDIIKAECAEDVLRWYGWIGG